MHAHATAWWYLTRQLRSTCELVAAQKAILTIKGYDIALVSARRSADGNLVHGPKPILVDLNENVYHVAEELLTMWTTRRRCPIPVTPIEGRPSRAEVQSRSWKELVGSVGWKVEWWEAGATVKPQPRFCVNPNWAAGHMFVWQT